MKMHPQRREWQICIGDSIKVIPFLHKQRLNDGFTPLVAFGIPNWDLRAGDRMLAQCVTDLRILCLARTAWGISAEGFEPRDYDVNDDKLRQLSLAGEDLHGNQWPKPKLEEILIEDLFRRIEAGEKEFDVGLG